MMLNEWAGGELCLRQRFYTRERQSELGFDGEDAPE